MSDGVVVQVANGDIEVNFGADGTVSGASTLTTLNRLTKVTSTGTVGMSGISELTAGALSGVTSLQASSSAGLVIKNLSGATVVDLGPGSGQSAAFSDGISAVGLVQTRPAATQDGVAIQGRAGGTSTYTQTLTTAALTGNRTATFPDAAITVAGSASALTSGRVPYVTTGGLLTDSALMLFASAQITLGDNTTAGAIVINGASGATKAITTVQRAGVTAWGLFVRDATDDYRIRAYDDAGTAIDYPLTIVRAAGGAITLARPVTCTGAVTVPNGTAAAPGIRTTTYAHGLYSIGATSVGVSVAGALILTVGATASDFASGTTLTVNNTTDATTTSDGSVRLSGGLSVAKATVGLTLKATSTADGAITTAGKITAKAAVPGSFADLAAVQTYLASILT